MKNIYIILSRSQTVFAKLIRLFTKKYYNHTSIALDKSLETFYSFGRRNPRLMFPAGFITEGVHKGFFEIHPDTDIRVLELEVTDEDYQLIQHRLEKFQNDPMHYKYDVRHVPYMMFEKKYRPKQKYVCSVFASELLLDIFDLPKDYSLMYPEDFYKLNPTITYTGKVGDYTYE